jgi:Ca-activated chloride channel family protein
MQSHNKEYYAFPLLLSLLLFFLVHTRGIKVILVVLIFLGIEAQASFRDDYYLISAYNSYKNQAFKSSQVEVKKIHRPTLQSRLLLAHTFYKEEAYKEALKVYVSIRSTSPQTKHYLYYHIANTHAMLHKYSKAKHYYAKALALKDDEDTRHNLHLIALLEDQEDASLGIAHPKSQSNASSQNSNISSDKEAQEEDKPSSSNGGKGEGSKNESPKEKPPSKLISDESETENIHPLGSKVYELINKGYIREKRPW